ncbi:MAG: 4-hydroxyphenylpyruvate dioxygenase [Oligoflexia bacterium]|nr:4-hydroxyphenylpyruvate dioxygenase [Oligoflexia bacterium]
MKSIDCVEFASLNKSNLEKQIQSWGFERLKDLQTSVGLQSLWGQGKIKILITQGAKGTEQEKFARAHGDGICDLVFGVDDAQACHQEALKRGAHEWKAPTTVKAGEGTITRASISAFGDVKHTFQTRKNTKSFSEDFDLDYSVAPKGFGMLVVDHLTCNTEVGGMEKWAEFYTRIFDFKTTRFFRIETQKTGLLSKVMENEEGTVKIPVNEPTNPASQIQEYLDQNKGPGVQHLAMLTPNIIQTLKQLKEAGQKFLNVPDTYYDEVPKRVKGLKEDLNELKSHRILADGDASGYLLQIFSENVVGPFFYEVIQRAGNQGFGEGNFRALFEAIERDQIRRGVLK